MKRQIEFDREHKTDVGKLMRSLTMFDFKYGYLSATAGKCQLELEGPPKDINEVVDIIEEEICPVRPIDVRVMTGQAFGLPRAAFDH